MMHTYLRAMKRLALLAVAMLGLSFAAPALAADPSYGGDTPYREGHGPYYQGHGPYYEGHGPYYEGRMWYGEHEYAPEMPGGGGQTPLYYRPTMRYYGNGYTVSYRYIPVYPQDSIYTGAIGNASNFRTEAFHIPTEDIPRWGANSPRLTVKDPHSAATHSTITTIQRKTSSGKKAGKTAPTDAAPAITPSAPAPATTQTPSPAPEAAPAAPAAPAAQPKP